MMTYISPLFDLLPNPNAQLYLAGESYAGQHIPYIAAEILKHNKEHGDVSTRDRWV